MPQNSADTDLIYTLTSVPGCTRDGTALDKSDYDDVVWCRFQRGQPRKMGGYLRAFQIATGVPRGMISQNRSGTNYIFIGDQQGLNVFSAGTSTTTGNGPYQAQISSAYAPTPIASVTSTTVFVVNGDVTAGFKTGSIIAFNALATSTYVVATAVKSGTTSVITTITTVTTFTGTPTTVYLVGASFGSDTRRIWQFDVQRDPSMGVNRILAHAGLNLAQIDNAIASPVYVGNLLPDASGNWVFNPLSDSTGQNPTYRQISVDGGVVSMYPFTVVYGSDGYIANNHVNQTYGQVSLSDWNGATANQVNVSATKILKGINIRGGSNSPSGLFWAQDSLIRMSFNSQATSNYWSYDLVGSGVSTLSANAIAQYGGVYYWVGVDRFYKYGGTVQDLKNDSNFNYFFDNLNFAQRSKVWTLVVPKFSEIWWFYPAKNADGTYSNECNNAIIYNVSLDRWYDAGYASGARRTCGYKSEVFPYPYQCGWEPRSQFLRIGTVVATPSGTPAPPPSSPTEFYVDGDQTGSFNASNWVALSTATGATIYKIVSSKYFYFSSTQQGTYVQVTPAIGVLAVGTTVFPTNATGYEVWQHEVGTDVVRNGEPTQSVYSSFTTNLMGYPVGTPAQDSLQGEEKTMNIVRVEPNFVQVGDMNCSVVTQDYGSTDVALMTETQTFNEHTEYLNFRAQEAGFVKLKFESDTIGGYYEGGKILVTSQKGGNRRG